MRLLVLGGTRFLGWHVAAAALERGHDVATFTRGVSGDPPAGVRALHGDRDDPAALPAALGDWQPELVVDTSCRTRAAARNAAAVLADVHGYAFVSSLNAYRNWPPGPIGAEDGEPTWDTEDDDYGPNKAFAEREIGAAVGDGFLTARAGLIGRNECSYDRRSMFVSLTPDGVSVHARARKVYRKLLAEELG